MTRSIVPSMLIVAAAVIGLCSVAPAAAEGEMPQMGGGWEHIRDVNDPHIQELGRWAVSEHVKVANDGLRFVKVVSGREQAYYGVSYELVTEATNGAGKSAAYGAVVYELENKTRELMAFRPTN
ncbi:hypothetical protein HU200_035158 [Digitaria exilis]|uniref:Cystatin domain-containing protein n=1 Tax=Digitaria exilis TaxID=1010633 RepID=A0A835BSB7_9POAL|nr:hypothetical protein HU200_035158 [Digitaria exilis]